MIFVVLFALLLTALWFLLSGEWMWKEFDRHMQEKDRGLRKDWSECALPAQPEKQESEA